MKAIISKYLRIILSFTIFSLLFINFTPQAEANYHKSLSIRKYCNHNDKVLVKFSRNYSPRSFYSTYKIMRLKRKLGAITHYKFQTNDNFEIWEVRCMSGGTAKKIYSNCTYITSISTDFDVEKRGEIYTPDEEPSFFRQWALKDSANGGIDLKKAWKIYQYGEQKSTTVAISDTGIDYNHEDLINNIWINPKELPNYKFPNIDANADNIITFAELKKYKNPLQDFNADGKVNLSDLLTPHANNKFLNGRDESGDGLIDDLLGWDFADNDNNPMDTNRHGTAAAGIIGAEINELGIAGINPNIRIMPVKIFQDSRTVRQAKFYNSGLPSLDYAAKNGAVVTNVSWGQSVYGPYYPQSERNKVKEIIEGFTKYNNLLVVAAGNDYADIDHDTMFDLFSEVNAQNIISVAATYDTGFMTEFSNRGEKSVDIAAPGDTIFTTFPTNNPLGKYSWLGGTSFAAPHVTGVTSLLYSFNPNLKYDKAKKIIETSVYKNNKFPNITSKTTSGGRLNAYQALIHKTSDRLVNKTMGNLSLQLPANINDIELKSKNYRIWQDACLGVSSPKTYCAQVLTPGYQIILSYKGRNYEYRTNLSGSKIIYVNSIFRNDFWSPPQDQLIFQ